MLRNPRRRGRGGRHRHRDRPHRRECRTAPAPTADAAGDRRLPPAAGRRGRRAVPATPLPPGQVVDIKVPAAGESITSANVASWRKKDGDPVAKGEVLVTAGNRQGFQRTGSRRPPAVSKILVSEGEEVAIGTVIARIETGERPRSAGPAQLPAAGARSRSGSSRRAPPPASSRSKPDFPRRAAPAERERSRRHRQRRPHARAARCRCCAARSPRTWSTPSRPPPF